MSTLESLAAVNHPNYAVTITKAVEDGTLDVQDLRRLLELRSLEYAAKGETAAQSYAKAFTGSDPRDVEGAKLFALLVNVEKSVAHADAGGKRPDPNDADDMEKLVREHMKAHPEISSKSRAYDAVARTDKGRALLARDRARVGIV